MFQGRLDKEWGEGHCQGWRRSQQEHACIKARRGEGDTQKRAREGEDSPEEPLDALQEKWG